MSREKFIDEVETLGDITQSLIWTATIVLRKHARWHQGLCPGSEIQIS
jgi:hypothetical protein